MNIYFPIADLPGLYVDISNAIYIVWKLIYSIRWGL